MVDFNEIYSKLSSDVYNDTSEIYTNDEYKILENAGWVRVSEDLNIDGLTFNSETGMYKNHFNGFAGAVYGRDLDGDKKADTDFTVAFRGTEGGAPDLRDIFLADGGLASQLRTIQFDSANKLLKAAASEYGNNITVTGHSLGGGLTQLVIDRYEQEHPGSQLKGFTYNAPGMRPVAEGNGISSNITNYVIMNDFIGTLNNNINDTGTNGHIGNTYFIMPEPIETNDSLRIGPHNNIREYTAQKAGKLYSYDDLKALGFQNGFTEEMAWALWYYDKNNDYININPIGLAFKTFIETQVDDKNLHEAVNILRKLDSPTQTLHYSTLGGDIILHTDKGEEIKGTNDILWGGEDTIYGNDGNDTIKGLGGDDTLYGDAGADSIDGGADHDKITVENFHNGDLGIKKLAA